MGNLLVAPITDKETHRGSTSDGQLTYAVSSMQGWRVHMEDAHILQGEMYAEEAIQNEIDPHTEIKTNPNSAINGSATKRAKTNSDEREVEADQRQTKYNKIDLPQHSLFAVYDGHGGAFAAEYAGINFVRVLARQAAFVEYAHFVNDLAARDAMENDVSTLATAGAEGEPKLSP